MMLAYYLNLSLVIFTAIVSAHAIYSGLKITTYYDDVFNYTGRKHDLFDPKVLKRLYIFIILSTCASIGYTFLITKWAFLEAGILLNEWHYFQWMGNHTLKTISTSGLHWFVLSIFKKTFG